MRPTPLQKAPQISPIFTADKVSLHISREKDGKLTPDGTIRRSFGQTAAGKLAGRGKAKPTPGRGNGALPLKNRDPPGPPPSPAPLTRIRTVYFSPSFLTPRYA
jgi:hypothetical protein